MNFSDGVTLSTPQGDLRGKVSKDRGVLAFRGVPYAVPPVGTRRWTVAEDLQGWEGVRDAFEFGPDCVQPSTMAFAAEPEQDAFFHPAERQSEDCLYLNVWTPAHAVQTGAALPVMVWIHGGAYVQGSGSWPLYDGEQLARKGVVVVTFNYRVGVFGFFSYPTQEPVARTGNYGTTDQLAVLRWVQRNISAYGGDRDCVTLFGESAGGGAVSELMAIPAAQGLFHRAIAQSAAAFLPMRRMAEAEEEGQAFASAIGCNSLDELRKVPASQLLRCSRERRFMQTPVVDQWLFPRTVIDTFEAGLQARVPTLIGFNRDEVFGVLQTPANASAYREYVSEAFGPFADRVLQLYPAQTWEDSFGLLMTYDWYGWATESWAKFTDRASGVVYLYYFAHMPAGARVAFHTSEIAFAFNNERTSPRYSVNLPVAPPRDIDLRLADQMSDYWVSFAKSADPNNDGHPHWPRYTVADQRFVRFVAGSTVTSQGLLPGAWELHTDINRWRRQAKMGYADTLA